MSLEQPHQIESTKTLEENTRGIESPKIEIEKQIHNWQLLIAIAVILGLGFVLGQKFQLQQGTTVESIASSTQTNILPVKTTVIEPVQSYSSTQTYTGEVTALRTSEVGFERGGKLIEVFVEEGDRVNKNTALAKLDTASLEAQRQGLIAQKEQAQAVLAELKNGARTEEIAAAQANVRDLQQQLELEKLRSSRREYLYDEGVIAREELDEIAFNQKALSERLANAQSNLAQLQNGTRVEQIEAQQAVVNRLTAEIKDLDITIDKSILTSPFNATVSTRNLDEGTVVEAGTSILRLVENTQPKVKIGVPINVANRMQPGSEQQVTIGGEDYSAVVNSVLPEVNTATRTRTVVLQLPPAAVTQSPQQIARLKVTQTTDIDGYWLPITALVKGERGLWSSYALAKTEDSQHFQAERRYIELLETQDNRALVRGTLQSGDEIIIDGTHRIIPGQLVKKS